jgi:hypothetical protein
MSLQVASPLVSWVLIAILLFWIVALFFGIGLFAESNSLVLSALAFGALSIAFAIFLILELGLPYTGLMRVSPAALEQAPPPSAGQCAFTHKKGRPRGGLSKRQGVVVRRSTPGSWTCGSGHRRRNRGQRSRSQPWPRWTVQGRSGSGRQGWFEARSSTRRPGSLKSEL